MFVLPTLEKFQFQYGAIIREAFKATKLYSGAFQFQYGAIIRCI